MFKTRKTFLLLIAWEDYTWVMERTEIIPGGKRMFSGCCDPLEVSPLESPLQFHSVLRGLCMTCILSHFQFTWQIQSRPWPLLNKPGEMLLYLSDAFSLATPKSFLISCHHQFLRQLHRAAILPLWPEPRLLHSDEPSLDLARVSCCDHMILVVISPHLVFRAWAEVITLSIELYLFFSLLHYIRPSQIRNTMQVL